MNYFNENKGKPTAVNLINGGLILGLVALSGCGKAIDKYSHINNKTKFSSSTFGVPASPRVTTSKSVRRGGGRQMVGKPYKIRGKWYYPKEDKSYDAVGKASWYGPNFHGRKTANGEIYDQYALSAAHPTFPLPSYARVTNVKNGKSVIVRVNDRGPYAHSRIIDLSGKAAELLDYKRAGTATVRVEYVGKARIDAKDTKYLKNSFKTVNVNAVEPSKIIPNQPNLNQSTQEMINLVKNNIDEDNAQY